MHILGSVMNKRLLRVLVGLTAVATVLCLGITALAEGTDEATGNDSAGRLGAMGRKGMHAAGEMHRARLSDSAIEAVADVLGMDVADVEAKMDAGSTLSDLAEEAGIDVSDLQAAIAEARETARREDIAQAVSDGDITQEHADWLLEGLDAGYIDGHAGIRGLWHRRAEADAG